MKKAGVLVLVFLIIASLIFINKDNILKMIYRIDYSEYVEKYSKEYNIDPLLVYSVIKAESNFNESAMSSKGACGLMQLMDDTAKEVATNKVMEYESGTTLYNAEKNIEIGVTYFAGLVKQFGNISVALAAYNAGSGNVTKWINQGIIKKDGSDIENIPFKETNMYVRKILRDYEIYKSLYK